MYLRIEVVPDAKKEFVEKKEEGRWLVSIREPAERNLANKRLRELVARELSVPLAQVRILTGHRARVKMISVTDT